MAVSKNTTLPKAVAEASPQQHCFSREVGFSAAFWPGANARRKRCSWTSGNLTQDDLYKFKYDAEHRLVEIRNLSNTLISSYAFDGHSLRVIKVWGADRTWYIYAGTQLVSEFEDAASASYSSGTNPGGAPSDSLSTLLYQHSDHLTTRLTTDQQGNLSNEQAHYPYGESWYATGTADPSVERKFTSYIKDSEVATGRLNYAVFREHSARVARFLTPDPLQIKGRSPQRLNRYSYVGNNPIMRTDRKGLDWDGGIIGPVDTPLEMDGGIMPSQAFGYLGGWNGAAERWHNAQQAPAIAASRIPVGCWDGSGFRDPNCVNGTGDGSGGGTGLTGGGLLGGTPPVRSCATEYWDCDNAAVEARGRCRDSAAAAATAVIVVCTVSCAAAPWNPVAAALCEACLSRPGLIAAGTLVVACEIGYAVRSAGCLARRAACEIGQFFGNNP